MDLFTSKAKKRSTLAKEFQMIRKDSSQIADSGGAARPGQIRHVAPAALHFFWALAVLAAGLFLVQSLFAFSDLYVQTALSAFLVLTVCVSAALFYFGGAETASPARFGAANAVTMGRGVLICLVAGAIGQNWSPIAAWTLVAVSTLALVMDGLDGWMARRDGSESAFGALFDQETDAAFILILAILLVDQGKAGVWIVLAGALRYLFVAAGLAVPRLRGELAPSLRRKTICVVQVIALVVCLAPVVPPAASLWIAAGSLALLIYSFAVDTVHLLLRQASPET